MKTDRYKAAEAALDILRTAGINQGDAEDADMAQAFVSLKRYITRMDEAEREAEEQKVRDFYRVQGILLREVDNLHVFRYNAARDYFTSDSA